MAKRLTRGQAIKAHCLECSGESWSSVETCSTIYCNLWEYRFGDLKSIINPDNAAYFDRDLYRQYLDIPKEQFRKILGGGVPSDVKDAESE